MDKFGWQKEAKREAARRGRDANWKIEPATDKQLEAIKRFGLTCNLKHVTKGQAGEIIQQLFRGVEPHWVEKLFRLKA